MAPPTGRRLHDLLVYVLLLVFVLLAMVAATLTVLPAAPATAAPVPSVPDYGPSIDPLATYTAESGCSQTEKPGAVTLRSTLYATYGSTIPVYVLRPCTPSDSGHEEGRALDWMTNVRDATQRDMAETFVGWLLATDKYANSYAMARRMGIMYIIWNSRMWRAYDPGRGWTEYSQCLTTMTAPSYDTTCHRNHVHLSLSWEGANAQTSFYTYHPGGPRICIPPAEHTHYTLADRRGLGYVPVDPIRLLDTRSGTGLEQGACRVGPSSRLDLAVTGRGGVPSTGVAAVVLNLTVTEPDTSTWVAAYPTGTAFGGTSSVNVGAGADAASHIVVPVGRGRSVTLRTGPGGPLDLVTDLVGYYPTGGSGAQYSPLGPTRILDSRTTRGFADRETRAVAVAGSHGVPQAATGVVVDLTVTGASGPGFLTASPSGSTSTSSLNFPAGTAVSNRAFVPLAADGSFRVYANRATQVVIDLVGWFGAGGSTSYAPVQPARILDTRDGTGLRSALVGGAAQELAVTGHAGVPAGAKAVVMTVTEASATADSWIAAWAAGAAFPGTSDVNFATGDGPRANLAVVPLSSDGKIHLAVGHGTAHVVGDVLGYYR